MRAHVYAVASEGSPVRYKCTQLDAFRRMATFVGVRVGHILSSSFDDTHPVIAATGLCSAFQHVVNSGLVLSSYHPITTHITSPLINSAPRNPSQRTLL